MLALACVVGDHPWELGRSKRMIRAMKDEQAYKEAWHDQLHDWRSPNPGQSLYTWN